MDLFEVERRFGEVDEGDEMGFGGEGRGIMLQEGREMAHGGRRKAEGLAGGPILPEKLATNPPHDAFFFKDKYYKKLK